MNTTRYCWTAALTLALLAGVASNAHTQEYQAGVARADITPTGPIWLAGYGNRNKPSEGVDHPLALKALALRHGQGPPLILITADIIGWPRSLSQPITERIGKELKVPRANVLLAASHTHTGPVISNNLEGMFDLKGKDAEAVMDYARRLEGRAVETAAEAVKALAPARLSFSRGRATFAMNRRVFRAGGVTFGVNPDGPVDFEVPVLRVEGEDGSVRAIVFGYACHCTTLTGNHYRISGDWAGFAQEYLERAHPGATALFVTGCGADANPEPRGSLELARQHGLELAGAVSAALRAGRSPVAGPLRTAFDEAALPFAKPPSREEFQKRLEDKNPFVRRHAARQLERLERDGKLPESYPCPVQVWQFGKDLTLVALGGEVVVDYALRLKRELQGNPVWVAAYCNDTFAYVPSVRILLEGGYEADFNLIYYGQPTRFSNAVEDVLLTKVHDLVKKVRP
ncbi:MAG TPA: neutral/alkaline non-lysosomal ceramidase N-terminal domain-containing protein [Gemmataceae bacterium]|nr:neutral/alkaline non-lysosomal ceramidase N-terminal domain-containing protein [Gemmataceae bacterium]